MKRPTLRRRIYSLLFRWFFLLLLVGTCVTFYSFSRFRADALRERMLLARSIAHYLDSTISASFQNMRRLSSELPSIDAAAAGRLRSYRFQSSFREAIYILDDHANKVVSDPASAEPIPSWRLTAHEAVTPLFYKSGKRNRPTLAIIQPFQHGNRRYSLVSEMSPVGSIVSTFLQSLATEPDLHVVVVDSTGAVIAAPDQKKLFRTVSGTDIIGDRISAHRPLVSESASCTFCEESRGHGRFLTVMVPLRFAPWGVVVQQPQRRAFSALYSSQYRFLAAGALLAIVAVLLALALSSSVVSPIRALSRQAELLRRGDLSTPIAVQGDRETELLAATLDGARKKLASTLAELQALNEDLEGQVASRTKVLQAQYEDLRLLHEVSQITTREREPDRSIPEILRLTSLHYSFSAVAMVTMPRDEPWKAYTFPEDIALAWLKPDAQPPAGWQRRDLVYQGRTQAQLFYPWAVDDDEPVMKPLQHQLAMWLHGAYLLERTLTQDAQRQVLVRRLLDAGEEERRRIARELHDEISQLLTLIQLSLESVPTDATEMQKTKDLLAKTQKEVHRIIYDLRPSLLDDLGLSAAVKWHAMNYLTPRGIQVSLEVEDDLRLPAEVEIATFRIYQEIATNILRHARAENVSIELYVAGDGLVLAVEDDGVGFASSITAGGAGIVGMRERAALVRGLITIDSDPGMGTHVLLKIPLSS